MVATPEQARAGRTVQTRPALSALVGGSLLAGASDGGLDPELLAIAVRFRLPGRITAIEPLGNGNVNTTYRVVSEGEGCWQFVLQRLNTQVFRQPELVMGNLLALGDHVARRLSGPPAGLAGRRWELPRVVESRAGGHWWCQGQQFWRMITYIEGSRSLDTLSGSDQAEEVGFALGMFHALIADLPTELLTDTLEGFHITPSYLAALERTLASPVRRPCADAEACLAFVDQRREFASVLEEAKAAGRLQLRPIHGDPKVNNVLLDQQSGQAIGLIDLDTVKPGLIHYDIGDALRSACNRVGEETTDFAAVTFDLEFCRALLEGYLSAARACLSQADRDHLYDAIRLIPFELGLRFLTDHLDGDVYFRADHPGHNLARARVQFQLTASIEAQEEQIRSLIRHLA
jgi:Ser/Thr protein kinase RdoA (MazF antagonist)